MKAIVRGRQMGKTTELIQLSSEKWYYIVCHSQNEAHRIYGTAKRMGLDIPLPITYDDFLNRQYHGRGIHGFLIDNVDMLLDRWSFVQVYAFTATEEANDGGA